MRRFVVLMFVLVAGCQKEAPTPDIHALRAMLAKDDVASQQEALAWITQMGAKAAELVPDLTLTLKSKHAVVRQETALALGAIGPAADDAIPELTKRLADTDYSVRKASAEALGKMGTKADSAIPALEKLSKSPDPCKSAENALKKIRS